ncbi:6-phospho-3-hexuloisomerase [Pectinatus frisingensis]|uniref:6-phospho-3-hexuloisomerase n=1 Tax=Pectinatus frisingensis TaxID=865 RepID=UPI0018C61057|nr:6-phospho-3-hexuloisomerase [Pectinatus frisingensis]
MKIDIITDELKRASSKITDRQLENIIDEIKDARSIFVYGAGRSGLMLKAFAMRLMQMNCTVYVVGETITPSIKSNDLLISASASGKTKSVIASVIAAQKAEAKVITITSDKKSELAKLNPPIICVNTPTKNSVSKNSVQPLGSLFEQMLLMICDAIILIMSEENCEINKIMSKRHANLE